MNIIVWKSYGLVSAFKAQTAAELNAVLIKMQVILAYWGMQEQFDRLNDGVQRQLAAGRTDRARSWIISFVKERCGDTEEFELFETTQVQ